MLVTKRRISAANRKIAGTGQFIDPNRPLTKGGKVRVVSEGDGTFLFYADDLDLAVRRALRRADDDSRRSEEFYELRKQLVAFGARDPHNMEGESYSEPALRSMRAELARLQKAS